MRAQCYKSRTHRKDTGRLGAGAPILVSLAALQGWAGPLWVVGLFVVLELFTNLVLETVLYAGAAGVSQVAPTSVGGTGRHALILPVSKQASAC